MVGTVAPASAASPPAAPAAVPTLTDVRTITVPGARLISMSPDGTLLAAERPSVGYQKGQLCTVDIATLAYRVTIRNASDTAQSVDVREERAGEWSVEQSSVPAEKVSSSVTRFKVSVPARGETVLTYRLRAVW